MRRNDLDYARGLAMLLIIIGHANGISEIELKIIYSFHVSLFFVISGMLLRYTNTAEKTWIHILNGWKKHILIPAILWEAILSAFYYVVKDITFKQLILNTVTMNFNLSVLWFIPCLLIAEIIWILIIKACKRGLPGYVICIIASGFAIAAELVNILFIRRILIATVFIIIGYVIEQMQAKKIDHYIHSTWTIFWGLCIIWGISMFLNIRVDLSAGLIGNVFLYYIHSIAGSMLVITICKWLPQKLQVLGWIGRNTMGCLVTHVFIRHAIIMFEEKLFGYFLDGWYLAIPMILLDLIAVWIIGSYAPELIGQKRLRIGVEQG